MNEHERQDPDNLYVTLTADEFFDAFGVRPPLGEWDVCCRPHCLHTERQLSLEMVRQRSMVMVIDSLG